MFRFGEPIYLYLLLIIPLLVVFYVYTNYRRRKKLRQYGDPELMAHLMPNVSKYRPDVKFWLVTIALVMVIFMLARPQFGSKMETVKRQGVETVVALDISNSMLAQDVTPSRLEKSKKLVSRLVETFNNDKVAMIVFAGEAFTQLPITSDYISAKMFLETISPSLITTQGTDIRGAIDLAMKSFTPNEGVGRAIVLITDGENHEDDAIGAAKEAHDKGIQINVLGVGNQKGGPIPMGNGGYLKDDSGNMVITRPDEKMAKEIAAAGKGIYVSANSNDALNVLDARLKELSKSNIQKTVFSPNDEQFPVFTWIALILLVIDIFVLDRKISWLKNINFFSKD